MKTKYIIILIIAACCFIAGCVENSNADSGRFVILTSEHVGGGDYIRIVHDEVLNVTIYQSASGYGYQSIAVIPDWQLKTPDNKHKVI